MNPSLEFVVTACSRGSENDSIKFPEQLEILAEAGVEGYFADLRQSSRTYYLPCGETIVVASARVAVAVAETFNAPLVEAAVRKAQADLIAYHSFCAAVMNAGCCGYFVSILGRRVVYFGRTAEIHVEHIPRRT